MRLPSLRAWYIFTCVLLLVYAATSAGLGRNQALTVFGNLVQQGLLLAAAAYLIVQAGRSAGRERVFWSLMSLGTALWALSQVEWVAHEVVLRTPVPDVSWGDILLFFHPVPWMAALLVRPRVQARAGSAEEQYKLDFSILMLWWIYLYAFAILAWQLPSAQHLAAAGRANAVLYLIENLLVLVMAGWWFTRSRGGWRAIYRNLMLGSGAYVLCSWMVHYQVFGYEYYTGCLYDLPLVAAICLVGSVGLIPRESMAASDAGESPAPSSGRWTAGLAAVALVSMPATALWTVSYSNAPQHVSSFRLKLTFVALPVMALLVLQKQRLLNRRLRRMLEESETSLSRQRQLQARLVESGKLAALGQLVAGIAHEINNPLTAILGYADILASSAGSAEEGREAGKKIGIQARRTKRHVESMLNFARQSPAAKAWQDVNSILSNVTNLRMKDLAGRGIRIEGEFASGLPEVMCSPNQLLQVFVQLIDNAIDAMEESGGGVLRVKTSQQQGDVVLEFSDTGPGVQDPQRIFEPFYTTKPLGQGIGLGLSTCYGIVGEHAGSIVCENRPGGGATFLVRLPGRKT